MFPNLPEIFGFLPAKCPSKSQFSAVAARLSPLPAISRVFLGHQEARFPYTQGPGRLRTGGFKRDRVSRSGPFCPFLSFFGPFPIFRDCDESFEDFPIGPFLLLGLLIPFKAPTRNIPERVSATIRTLPEKSGKPPALETPRFTQHQPRTTTITEAHI